MELSLNVIEQQLTEALKSKNQISVDTLRGLKTRITNEQIAKGDKLTTEELLALVKSEAKRRKEAIVAYQNAGRTESMEKEAQELQVLSQFLPEQLSQEQIISVITEQITQNNWTVADFGKAMGALKTHFGDSADGAVVSQLLKERLK